MQLGAEFVGCVHCRSSSNLPLLTVGSVYGYQRACVKCNELVYPVRTKKTCIVDVT